MSECLYVELANSSVGITCVHPGAVATNILEAARMDPTHKEKMLKIFHLAMPPEKAALLIVKAIEKNRFKLVFCVESRILGYMKQLGPVATLKLMRVNSMKRRDFLKYGGASVATLSFTALITGCSEENVDDKDAFWRQGNFPPVTEEITQTDLTVEGLERGKGDSSDSDRFH